MTPVFEKNTKGINAVQVYDGNANLTKTKADNPNKGFGNNSVNNNYGNRGNGQSKPYYTNNLAANINGLTIKNGNLNNRLKTALTNNNSSVYYSGIYNNIDIQYILEGKSLKENIIVYAPQEEYSFKFELGLVGLRAEKTENGDIAILNADNELLYIIPRGFMKDANGVHSDDVEYSLTQSGGGVWFLTVTAGKDFFDTAAFPVTIDPTIQTTSTSFNVGCHRENADGATAGDFETYYPAIGYDNSAYIDIGTAFNYNLFENIFKKGTVLEAKLAMNYGYTGSRKTDDFQITLRKSKDYRTLRNAEILSNMSYTKVNYKLTIDVFEYFTNYIDKATISIKEPGRSSIGFSSPVLTIIYAEQKYNDYNITQDMGEGGTGIVSLSTGNLSYVYEDIVINDGNMPITISHIYSEGLGTAYNVGNNFKLNIQQCVKKDGDFYYYINAMGQKYYFTNSAVPEIKLLGLKLYKDTSTGIIRLIDRQGNSLVFDADGDLIQIHQYPSKYGSTIPSLMMEIQYAGGRANKRIDCVKNNKTTLRFNCANPFNDTILLSITNETTSHVLTNYVYVGGNLTQAKKFFTSTAYTTSFTYSGSRLMSVANGNAKTVSYGYTSNQVTSVTETVTTPYSRTDTIGISYKINSGNQNNISRTALLNHNGTHTQHVSFDSKNNVVSDYAYKNKSAIIPSYAISNSFDYFGFLGTYADTRSAATYNSFDAGSTGDYVADGTNTKSQYLSSSSAVNLTVKTAQTSGTHSYALSVWAKKTAASSSVSFTVNINGTGANSDYEYFFNKDVTEWQFATIILKEVTNLTSLSVVLNTNGGVYFDCLRLVKLPTQLSSEKSQELSAKYNDDGQPEKTYRYNFSDDTISTFVYVYNAKTHADYPGQLYSLTEYSAPASTAVVNLTSAAFQKSKTIYTYTNGQVSEIKTYGTSSSYVLSKYTFVNGQLTSFTDENGVKTTYSYNSDGTFTAAVTGGTGSPSISTIDTYQQGTGLLTKTVTGSITTEFDYNNFGGLWKIKHNGFNTTFNYYDDGSLKNITVPNKTLVSYTYSQAQDTVTYGNAQTVKYNYNADNYLTSMQNTSNSTIASFTYGGALGELSQISNTGGATYSYNQTNTDYTYQVTNNSSTVKRIATPDSAGNLTDKYYLGTALKASYTYIFNARGLLTNITKASGSISYAYDNLYRLTSKTTALQSGFVNSYTYKTNSSAATNMVQTQTMKYGGTQKSGYTYEYYANGNLKKIYETAAPSRYVEYQYDQYNRLTYEYNIFTGKYSYYNYDNGGNLTHKQEEWFNGNWDYITYYYDYSWRDQLIAIESEGSMDYNYYYFSYDGAGNPATHMGNNMTWKNGRQLASYKGVTYDYDYAGIRTRKGSTYYYTEGSRVVAENGPNGFIWYYYDESGVSGMNYGGADYYFDKNLLGDIIGIYDTIGTLKGDYVYDAWGNILSQSNNAVTNANPFRYRGYYYDSETALYYLNSRYYDPAIGRFVNADDPTMLYYTADMCGGANLFAYCLNNPIAYTDPSGQFILTAFIAAILIGAAISAGTAVYKEVKEHGWDMDEWNWGAIGVAALSGAVQGGIFYFTGGVSSVWTAVGIGFASGLAGNAISQIGTNMLNGQSGFNWSEWFISGAIGGLAGGLSFGIGKVAKELMGYATDIAQGAISGTTREMMILATTAGGLFLAQSVLPGATRGVMKWLLT